MKIDPKQGIDQLLFGMKRKDVTAIYGQPDKEFKDDEHNIIYIYNLQKWRLTFYEDEDFRLGYIICSHPNLKLLDQRVIGSETNALKAAIEVYGFKNWEQEDFDLVENHFNEANWMILQSEYDEVIKIEIGAIINENDEFEWQFPKK